MTIPLIPQNRQRHQTSPPPIRPCWRWWQKRHISFVFWRFWRRKERRRGMNVGCCNERGKERLLLFLIIVPLSLYPPGRKNFRCAESYPRGVGSTIMDGNRTTGRSWSLVKSRNKTTIALIMLAMWCTEVLTMVCETYFIRTEVRPRRTVKE